MTKWREYYDSSFLKPEDVAVGGETYTVTVVDPGAVESEEDKTMKHQPVVAFAETKARWGVNVINRLLIEAIFGDEIENAIGGQITLYQTPCEVAGKYKGKPSIRVMGSPDLKAALTVEIKLPKRKPFTRELVPTKAAVVASNHQPERETRRPATHEDFSAEPSDEVKSKVEPETSDPRDAAERAAYVASVVKAMKDGPVSNKALGEKLAEYGVSLVIDLDDGQLEDYTTWHDELAKAIRAERAER
jgi:hypothetical protein